FHVTGVQTCALPIYPIMVGRAGRGHAGAACRRLSVTSPQGLRGEHARVVVGGGAGGGDGLRRPALGTAAGPAIVTAVSPAVSPAVCTAISPACTPAAGLVARARAHA